MLGHITPGKRLLKSPLDGRGIDMSINLVRTQASISEKLLNEAQVSAIPGHVSGITRYVKDRTQSTLNIYSEWLGKLRLCEK
jgi:hypothetical protein